MEQINDAFSAPCPRRMANYLLAFEDAGKRHPSEELNHYVRRVNDSLSDIEMGDSPNCDLVMNEQSGAAICPRVQCED